MTRPAAIKEFGDAILRLKWAVQDARLSVAERRELDDSIMDVEVAHAERLRVALEPDPVQPQPPSYQALVAAVADLHQHAMTVVGNGQLVKLIGAAHMAALEYAVATRWAPDRSVPRCRDCNRTVPEHAEWDGADHHFTVGDYKPRPDSWSAAARAVMDRSTPAEGTPIAAPAHCAVCSAKWDDYHQQGGCPGWHSAERPVVCDALHWRGQVAGGVLVTYRCVLPPGHDGEHADALAARASGLVALDLSDCEDAP